MFWTNRNVNAGHKAVSTGDSFHHNSMQVKLFTCQPSGMRAQRIGTVKKIGKKKWSRDTDSEQGRDGKRGRERGTNGWVYNPGHIKLQGVLLNFYVNNVNRHTVGKLVVDAALIKQGHLLYQQDLTKPEMRPVLSAVCCYEGPFTQNTFDDIPYVALNAKAQIFYGLSENSECIPFSFTVCNYHIKSDVFWVHLPLLILSAVLAPCCSVKYIYGAYFPHVVPLTVHKDRCPQPLSMSWFTESFTSS